MSDLIASVLEILFDYLDFRDLLVLSHSCRQWRTILNQNRREFWRRKWSQVFHGPPPYEKRGDLLVPLCFHRLRFDERRRLALALQNDEQNQEQLKMLGRLLQLKTSFLNLLNSEERWQCFRNNTHGGHDVYFHTAYHVQQDETFEELHLRLVIFLPKTTPLKLECNYDRQLLRGNQEERLVFGSNYTGEILAYYLYGEEPIAADFSHKRMAHLNDLLLFTKGRRNASPVWLFEVLQVRQAVKVLERMLDMEQFWNHRSSVDERRFECWEDSWRWPVQRDMFSLSQNEEEDSE